MDSGKPPSFPKEEPLTSNKTKFIVIGVFVVIAIALGIAGLVVAETKPTPTFSRSLVSANNSTMTLVSGDGLLYLYDLGGTPAQGKSKFSGEFSITIDAPGIIPSVNFRVEDQFGNNITETDKINKSRVSTVPFKGNRETSYIQLFANVSNGNQNLQNIQVSFN